MFKISMVIHHAKTTDPDKSNIYAANSVPDWEDTARYMFIGGVKSAHTYNRT